MLSMTQVPGQQVLAAGELGDRESGRALEGSQCATGGLRPSSCLAHSRQGTGGSAAAGPTLHCSETLGLPSLTKVGLLAAGLLCSCVPAWLCSPERRLQGAGAAGTGNGCVEGEQKP